MLCAMSIAQGGCGFPYFVYDYLCGWNPVDINIDHTILPSVDERELLNKVSWMGLIDVFIRLLG